MTTETENTEEKTAENGSDTNAEASAEIAEEMQEQLEAKKEEPDYKERFLYIAAEMENFKRRVEREKSQLIKFGNENILRDLIEVVDNFERTVNAIKTDDDEKMKNVVVGIEMINKQFMDTLKKYGLTEVETSGSFDPNFHEAIAQDDQDGAKPMDILAVHQKGYTLNERLVRPARVVVQKDKN